MKNLFLVFAIFLVGCISRFEKAETQLKTGMSKAEVFEILGYPDGKSATSMVGTGESYWYTSTSQKNSIYIEFDKDGKFLSWCSEVIKQ